MGSIFSINISCDALFSCCLDCTAKQVTFTSELEDNLDVLQIELQKLIETRSDVMRRITIAEQQQMIRTDQVQGWLTRVQAVEAEVDELLKLKSQEIERLCFGGFCSKNCMSSYKFGKKVVKKLKVVSVLKGEGGNFQVLAERAPCPLVDERPIEPTVGLESTFDQVWRCLMEEKVGIIGIYGMGGVGKTTLLTQINNKFIQMQYDFDVVIWIVVSKDLQLEKIQETIGKKIGLVDDQSWKNKSFEEKAIEILKCLRKKKFVLLLDDIWELVDLTEIGVPQLPSFETASKVVFTTRFIDVCGQMGAHEKFEVKCLTDGEARKLFHKKVGSEVLNSHADIPKLAETLINECGGLPLALITIGRAMACMKTPQEWEYAIEVLRTSASKFTGMEKVYSRLKFSYDSLPNDTIRSCLLYCCLYPEDYSISKTDLIDCWIGEGFLNEYDGSRARNQGYYIIGVLLHTCLLEDVCLLEEEKSDDYIKMHDVIRDMMLWIACENSKIEEDEKEKLLVCAGAGLTKAPEVEKWARVRQVSLMENQIKYFSETPTCPHLLTLFLNSNRLQSITSDFFNFMPSLRVLNLSKNLSLFELPSGISKLVSLQHLDLSKTNIKRLPKELEALSNLKCLNLENTYSLSTIPRHLIKKLSALRILRLFKCNFLIESDDSQFFVEELCCLEHLNVLTISLKNSKDLQQLLRSQNLQTSTQSLCLKRFYDSKSLTVSSLAEMKNLDRLHLYECCDLEELTIDCKWKVQSIHDSHIFYNLHTVDIYSCFKLRDLTWLALAPNLKRLRILFSHMEEIISVGKIGEVSEMMGIAQPFEKLEFLELRYLRKLKCIYWNPLPFQQLKEIRISDCPELKQLPLNSDSAKERKNIVIVGEKSWWKKLQWEDQATENAFLPCFESIDDDSETEFDSEAELEEECEEAEDENDFK
ncbi:hypothetical protein LWI28_002252 [Acer negundo]|uniref:AAA+ ATPase domain-containing protein n=1 Tax=Acer negundo TaxID=4023 RepID=A0AAD5NHW0_ACENE|nr:hypothetical protein LWI28_002252 [Acer negundo]